MYLLDGRRLVDVQQTIPHPEAADYQVQIRKKILKEKAAQSVDRDLTKYDVTIGEDVNKDLPKRRAIFSIVKHLCNNGVAPEAVAESIPDRNPWRSIDQLVYDTASFQERINSNAALTGKVFDERRWFMEASELVHFSGRTYVFRNQWGDGKAGFSTILSGLIAKFGASDVTFTEHE